MIVVLLGPPGAGKGTQCKRVADKYQLTHLSSGDILRAERAAGSELGAAAQKYMDSGGLVPDDLIIKMMVNAIKKANCNCLLDGFPRTVNQAKALDQALAENNSRIDAVVSLEIDDNIVAKRLTGRRSCPMCGAVYHIQNLKPKQQGICDNDGTQLTLREDDKPEVVDNRLKTYHQQTAAVLDYYENVDALIYEIDANQQIDLVSKQISAELDKVN